MALTHDFDLVPVNGALRFTEANWDKARFWLLEFQPAKRVALVGDPPNAIRVTGYGADPEVAPGILARLCELAGVELRVVVPPHRAGDGPTARSSTHVVSYVFNSLLSRLVGWRLYSVEFVLDYVQLRFDAEGSSDDPVLTCDVRPRVTVGHRSIAPRDAGWADALVALAGQTVVATYEAMGDGVRIDFATGSVLLRPDDDELVGPEIATLNGFDTGRWMCWRPGEEAFEYL